MSTATDEMKAECNALLADAYKEGYDYDEAKDVMAAIVAFTGDWDDAKRLWRLTLGEDIRGFKLRGLHASWRIVRNEELDAS